MERFDYIDLFALIVIIATFTLASIDGISLQTEIVRITVYAALATLFGTKVLKAKGNKGD